MNNRCFATGPSHCWIDYDSIEEKSVRRRRVLCANLPGKPIVQRLVQCCNPPSLTSYGSGFGNFPVFDVNFFCEIYADWRKKTWMHAGKWVVAWMVVISSVLYQWVLGIGRTILSDQAGPSVAFHGSNEGLFGQPQEISESPRCGLSCWKTHNKLIPHSLRSPLRSHQTWLENPPFTSMTFAGINLQFTSGISRHQHLQHSRTMPKSQPSLQPLRPKTLGFRRWGQWNFPQRPPAFFSDQVSRHENRSSGPYERLMLWLAMGYISSIYDIYWYIYHVWDEISNKSQIVDRPTKVATSISMKNNEEPNGWAAFGFQSCVSCLARFKGPSLVRGLIDIYDVKPQTQSQGKDSVDLESRMNQMNRMNRMNPRALL